MTTTTDLYTPLNNHPQQIQDSANQYPNTSIGPCASVHYQPEHRSPNDVIGNHPNPPNSLIHLMQSNNRASPNSNHNENQCSDDVDGQATGSITINNENMNDEVPPTNQDALYHEFKPNLAPGSLNPVSSPVVPAAAANSPLIKSHDRLALSSIINADDGKPNVDTMLGNFSLDITLDEDAPHEEDDGGTENESTYISLPIGETYQGSNADVHPQSHHGSANLPPFPSWTSAHQPSSPKTENKPPTTTSTRPASQRKRKRNSVSQSHSTKPPASSATTRSKPAARVKSAEQLATEALIEQQNPHATKNELRSLKLRALHAVRIAERELNMPEAEKQRRLRLREYVRQKRAEERSQKNSTSKQASSGRQSNAVVSGAHPTASSISNSNAPLETSGCKGTESNSQDANPAIQLKDEADFPNQQENPQSTVSYQSTALETKQSSLQPSSVAITSTLPPDHAGHSKSAPTTKKAVSSGPQRQSKPKASKPEPKAPRKKGVSRVTPSATSLELEIKHQHPNASPAELKSLKLRALHAVRIAEREQNMSDKEKLRRHNLREYMRRRRDEERNKKCPEPNIPIEVCPTSDSHTSYRRSFDSSMNGEVQLHTHDSAMSSQGGPLGPEETNTKERFAAFSMVDVGHTYHGQFQQAHQAPPSHPDHLHINPLFHMPMTQSSLDVASPYDCSMQTAYGMADTWSHLSARDHEMTGGEAAQKALHAAIQEAIYMKPHHEHALESLEQHGEHVPSNGETMETHRLAGMGHEEVGVAGDGVLGIMRARELAMIAAAAAEVEHAQQMQMQSSTSSHLH